MEFGAGILGRIAEAFCDSPWISQEDYEQTLHEVTGLFYEFKMKRWTSFQTMN